MAGGVVQLERNATMDAILGQQAEDDEDFDLGDLEMPEPPADFEARRTKMYELADEAGARAAKSQQELDDLAPPKFEGVPPPPPQKATNPLEAFGSTASWLAIFGSLLTRQPLQNALNGAADVIDAYKANDLARAKTSYDSWKRNTDFAEQNFKFELDTYKAALDKIAAGSKVGFAELQAHAAAFKNDTMLLAARERNAAAVFNAYNSAQRMKSNLAKSKVELEKLNERQELYAAEVDRKTKELGRPLLPREALEILNSFMTEPRAGQTAAGGLTPNQSLSQSRRAWLDKYGEKDFYGNVVPKEGAPTYEEFIDSGEWERLKGKVTQPQSAPAAQPKTPPAAPAKPAAQPQASGSLTPESRAELMDFFKANPGMDGVMEDGSRWRLINGQIVAVPTGPSGGNLTLAQAEALGSKVKPKGGQTPQQLREEEERARTASYEYKKELEEEEPLNKGEMEAFDASLAPRDYDADLRTQFGYPSGAPVVSRKGEIFIRNPLPPKLPERAVPRSIDELRRAPISSFSAEELRAYGKAGPAFIEGMALTDDEKKIYDFVNATDAARIRNLIGNDVASEELAAKVELTLRDAIKRRMDIETEYRNIVDTRPKEQLDVNFNMTQKELQAVRDQLDGEIAELLRVKSKLQGAKAPLRKAG